MLHNIIYSNKNKKISKQYDIEHLKLYINKDVIVITSKFVNGCFTTIKSYFDFKDDCCNFFIIIF